MSNITFIIHKKQFPNGDVYIKKQMDGVIGGGVSRGHQQASKSRSFPWCW